MSIIGKTYQHRQTGELVFPFGIDEENHRIDFNDSEGEELSLDRDIFDEMYQLAADQDQEVLATLIERLDNLKSLYLQFSPEFWGELQKQAGDAMISNDHLTRFQQALNAFKALQGGRPEGLSS